MSRFIDTPEFVNVVRRVKTALRGFDLAMIGGRAVEVWANPPQTPDIDFLVKFSAKQMNKLLVTMNDEHFELKRKFFDVKYAPMLFFKDMDTGTEVDLIGAFEDVHSWAIERSVVKKINGLQVTVAQAEDIVILKANAALTPRRGEKVERDIAAIKAIVKKTPLDLDYIEIVLTQAMADWTDEIKLLQDCGVKIFEEDRKNGR